MMKEINDKIIYLEGQLDQIKISEPLNHQRRLLLESEIALQQVTLADL